MSVDELIVARPRPDFVRICDIKVIRKISHGVFDHHGKVDYTDEMLGRTDWTISRVLRDQGKIIGYYLLVERSVLDVPLHEKQVVTVLEDLSRYRDRRGVEGILLWVDPAYRGLGLGNLLKDLPAQYGCFDYVWGAQTASLGNLHHWLKRRRLVMKAPPWGNGGEWYVTLEDLT